MQLNNTHKTLFFVSIAKIVTRNSNMLSYTNIACLITDVLKISKNINFMSKLLSRLLLYPFVFTRIYFNATLFLKYS